ncbi:MAG: hypothetical protein ACRDOE_00515 [Streptosporangiaceae bacterium]
MNLRDELHTALLANASRPADELAGTLATIALRRMTPRTSVTTSTRTHTHYFGGELVEALDVAFQSLVDDYQQRTPFVDTDTRRAMLERLEALRLAVARLRDRAD